jgi:UPF0755 protein
MPDVKKIPKPQPIDSQSTGLRLTHKISKFLRFPWVIIVTVIVILAIVAGFFVSYNIELSPIGRDVSILTKVVIAKGSTSNQIGKQLQNLSIIRSASAFDIYTRLTNKNSLLQAGIYRLSSAESTPQIVSHLVNGSVDTFSITFFPGGTLADAVKVLQKAGYSNSEINIGLNQSYSGPLFAGKPVTADLEGYIFGQTNNFNTGAKVQDILQTTFDEFYKQVNSNNLVKDFNSHGLNLYQGIILASIVQKEASDPQDQKQVAQVFYSRLSQDMVLGSDVTYQYIADKTGVPRDPNIDSLYNTRRYTGLPPGPIATPGLSALLAVANPAKGDYLYFLAGDDGVMYFANTLAEHEANITNHCKINCSTP